LTQGLQERLSRLMTAQERVATGKAINRLTDDPGKVSDILHLRNHRDRTETYIENLRSATQRWEQTDSLIQHLYNTYLQTKTLALRGANDALDETGRRALAQEVDALLEEILTTLNQKQGTERVLFGEVPWTIERDERGTISSFHIRGSASSPYRLIVGQGEQLLAGMSFEEVILTSEGNDIISPLINLREALYENNGELIRESLSQLNTILDHLNFLRSVAGSFISRTHLIEERLTGEKVSTENRLSQITDGDIVNLITQFTREQIAYQTAIAASAKLLSLNLFQIAQ
ncbi:MAG: flagellin, partial [bacterium]